MILFKAFEAKAVSTRTVGGMVRSIIRPINNLIFTSFFGTPLEESAFVCKLLDVPLKILLSVINAIIFVFFLRKISLEETVRDYDIAV